MMHVIVRWSALRAPFHVATWAAAALVAVVNLGAVTTVAQAATTLLPEDHTILWPLKFSPAQDSVFKATGDGFCNAPALVADRIIKESVVNSIFAQSFNASGGACVSNPKWTDLIFERSPEQLLDPNIPLIQVNGIPPNVCNPALWRVVALRADPCQNIIENRKSGTACKPQVRLVLQPFERSQDGLQTVLDFTLHLIFAAPDIKALRKDLETVAQVSRKSAQSKPWDPSFDGKPVFRPHHGLRNELGTCNGPVAQAIRSFIAKYAVLERLTSAATMGSTFAVKEWTFFAFKGDGAGNAGLVEINGARFDNYSDTLFAEGKYSMNPQLDQGTSFPTIRRELTMAAEHKTLTAGVVTKSFSNLQTILNPLLTTQLATNCSSCHLAPQTILALEKLSGTSGANVPEAFKATVWPGFAPAARSYVNLRNLGYGPGFSLSINRRTINEVMLAQQWFEQNR